MARQTVNATRVVASTFGVMAGLAGIEHGVGEALQGNRAPTRVVIEAWPGAELFRILAGEPALTLVPNFLVTGLLSISVSLALLVWAVAFVQRKRGGLVLILLSIAMFLVGGGFGSALVGLIAGLVATRINASFTWWQAHLSGNLRHLLATLWPWSFALCIIAWLTLLPGSLVIGYFFPLIDPSLIAALILLAFGSLLATIIIGFAHDSSRPGPSLPLPAL